MGSRKGWAGFGCAATLLLIAGSAGATTRANPLLSFRRTTRPGLDSQLVKISQAQQQHGQSAALGAARAEELGVDQSRVRVIVEAKTGDLTTAQGAVAQVGGTVVASADGLIEALVPPGGLDALATSAGVERVRPPAHMQLESVDEGVAATNASLWQASGYDGTGIKVAVIDGGFAGYQTALAGASVTTIDHCGGQFSTATEHGTAVAELIHQMAPGAQLLLICVDTEVDLALAEQDAISQGAKIINHSVGWFNTSRGDGTGAPGTPDAIAADARVHGITWVNAAGNHAEDHWSGTFTPVAGDPDVHSFGGSDFTNTVTIFGGEEACAFLKWDAWPKTTEDFDLVLVRESDGSVVDASSNDQASGALPPTEELCYTNTGATAQFGLAIVRFSASTSPRFDLFYTGDSSLEYRVPQGSIIEPASSPATIAAGADCWQNGTVEPYSSQGPTIDGRVKPDLLAPDSVSTTTYGAFTACGSSGFPGTSAAAPQVAGAAALLLQKSPATPGGLRDALLAATQGHTNVAPNNSTGVGPLWLPANPSGGRLAYSTPFYGDIVVAGSDGSGGTTVLHQAAANYAHPSWSPDGNNFAVTRIGSGTSGLDVVKYDGTGATQICDAGGATLYHAAYAPDGTSVAFDMAGSIVVAPATGGCGSTLATGTSPAWKPDSTKIAYVANGAGGTNPEIWVMNSNGSSQTQLTTGAHLTGVNVDVGSPSWSPDGTKIIYAIGGSSPGIYEMNADGTNQHVLAPAPAGDFYWDPVWSPDGKMIAFVDYNVGSDTLHEALADGSHDTNLGVGSVASPSWISGHRGASIVSSTAPVIGGTAQVGEQMEASAGSWAAGEPLSVTTGWERCIPGTQSCTNVFHFDSTYTLTAQDVGFSVRANVTASSPFVTDPVTANSATSDVVGVAKPYTDALPIIVGTKTVGSALTATSSLASWSGATSLAYQWRRCDTDGSSCTNIAGATAPTYTLTSADLGATIRVAVSGQNTGGSTVITSLNTSAIAGAASPPAGGGGGGGGGSSSITLAVTPATQSVSSGGTATWRIAVTNAGGAYLYAVGVNASVPSCGIPASFADSASLMPPQFTIAYNCTLAGVTSNLTLSVVANATTGPGDKLTQTATATVTVAGGASGPSPAPTPSPTPSPAPKPVLEGKTINGTAKADHLNGTNLADVINGRGGNDVIRALGGNDKVNGGAGNDTVFGGAGNDKLTGGPGADKLNGGAGNDTIYARDGTRDTVDCGSGKDTVYADGKDVVAHNCESVHRSGAAV